MMCTGFMRARCGRGHFRARGPAPPTACYFPRLRFAEPFFSFDEGPEPPLGPRRFRTEAVSTRALSRRLGWYGLSGLTSRSTISTQVCFWLCLDPACHAPSRSSASLTPESHRHFHCPLGGRLLLPLPPN